MSSDLAGLAKLCLVGCLLFTGYLLFPVGKCTYQLADQTQIQSVVPSAGGPDRGSDYDAVRTSDVARVSSTSGFLGRFFGSAAVCYRRQPLTSNEPWEQYLAGGLGGGAVLLFALAQITARERT